MKIPLLLLLALPLSAAAQMNGSSFSNANYQISQRHAQMASDFQRRSMDRSMARLNASSGSSRVSLADMQAQRDKRVAKQQQAEQEANAKMARLVQEQERRHAAAPAKTPQQAAAQQQEDARQRNLLAVKNYHDVFLPGQVATVRDEQQLSPGAQRQFDRLADNLTSDAWWSKQSGAALADKLRAYSDTLTSLTTGLLGFDLAAPPATPAQLAPSRVDELLATGAFDPKAAQQLIEEVALAEKLIAGKSLAAAVLEFRKLNAPEGAGQLLQSNPKKLHKSVEASLDEVNGEMYKYSARLASLTRLNTAQDLMLKSTARYVAKNSK